MRKTHRPRRLVVGDQCWLWTVRHRHPECREVLSLRREGSREVLRIVFRPGPGRFVPDGFLHSGAVMDDRRRSLNLHEPGVVRKLLDAAVGGAALLMGVPPLERSRERGRAESLGERGALPATAGARERELDGWPLFDAVAGSGPVPPSPRRLTP
ncbi:hypothetical protein [Streptomyces noursei]|uniref:Uncharacterized protein n=1 Tax=Streptomyces noursei TaxID=1971 RepID=A0A2N8P4S9_STRNR|nr:hypothetical protein [Streptomyces noursei]PNE36050.1 hypothetical protein AOB60_38510 [Streptomyces noursei]